MRARFRRAMGCILFLVPFVLTGCVGEAIQEAAQSARTAATQAQTRNHLRELGLLYHAYHDVNRQGPPSWEEAKAFAQKSAGSSQPLDELQKAGYRVAWGMRFRDVTIGISNFVLAYPPDGAQKGGVVLMMDGAVVQMPPDQLQSALQNQASIKPAAGAGGGASASPPPGAGAGGMGASPAGAAGGERDASLAGGLAQASGVRPASAPGFAGAAASGFPGADSTVPPGGARPAGRPPGAFPPVATGGGSASAGPVNLAGPGAGPVTAETKVHPGDRLLAHWGAKWYDVTVLDVLADGRLKIHWEGYSDSWDEAIARDRLRLVTTEVSHSEGSNVAVSSDPSAGAAAVESPAVDTEQPFRLWTDATGQFQTEAQLIEVRGDQVTLRKRDGRLLTLPLEKLSAQDRILVRSN